MENGLDWDVISLKVCLYVCHNSLVSVGMSANCVQSHSDNNSFRCVLTINHWFSIL